MAWSRHCQDRQQESGRLAEVRMRDTPMRDIASRRAESWQPGTIQSDGSRAHCIVLRGKDTLFSGFTAPTSRIYRRASFRAAIRLTNEDGIAS